MLSELREQVWLANIELVRRGLVAGSFGNASGIDRKSALVAIKPSGVDYSQMKPGDLVIVDLDGKPVEGGLRPSSDTPTHLAIYRAFDFCGGVAHTHSEYATIFAQALREIPCLGTTHADHFAGAVPVTRLLLADETRTEYEANTGKVIVERFAALDPLSIPAVLVAGHGPFAWGESAWKAVETIDMLEKIARIAWGTLMLNPQALELPPHLAAKHFGRKHGPHAYYGQKEKE